MSKLLSYETIIKAHEDDTAAMNEVLSHYAGYIRYRKAEAIVDNYNRELAEWERKVKESRRPAEKERYAPPEKQSVRDQLRRLQAEGKQKPKHRSHNRER